MKAEADARQLNSRPPPIWLRRELLPNRRRCKQRKRLPAKRPPEQAKSAALRAQLLQQLNAILQTTDTPRGLVVNMADVLFATTVTS